MASKNRRMFELRLGKLGLVLFVGVMSVLLCSMFLLGIFVGKQIEAYPERFSPGVVAFLQANLLPSRSEKVVPLMETVRREPAAAAEEAPPAELPGGKKEEAPAPGAASPKDQPEPLVPQAVPAVKPPAAGPVVGAAAGAAGTAQAGTADGQGSPAEGLFEVQVAAYQEQRKAEQMMGKLKPLGFAPRTVEKELPGKGVWYRVVIGGFETREKAKAAADSIAGKLRGVKCVIRSAAKNGGA
jgi:cell division protein FtsN